MRLVHALLLILGLAGPWGGAAPAVAAEEAAFLQPQVTLPTWSDEPLRVVFRRDVEKCRTAYGEVWWEKCFVALGTEGAPAPGVELRGEGVPAGEWRWEDYETLIYRPTAPWREKTALTVDLGKLATPLRAKLHTRLLTASTLPLAGQSPKGEVWVDPSPSGPRAVSFAVRFSAPVDRSLERSMTLKTGSPGVGLGKMQVIWGQDATSCVVRVPLTALPDNDALLTLQIAGVRPLSTRTDTGRPVLLAGTLQQSVTVPGKKQLFRVQSAALELLVNKNLKQEYILKLKTSLRVPVAEMLKALQVVELPRLQNPEAAAPYAWNTAPAISRADLDKARPLQVVLESDPGMGTEVVLRVPASADSFVHVQLPAGFGPAGYALSAPWSQVFHAKASGTSVHFLQPGHVLTLIPGGDNRLDLASYGVDEVRWRAARFRADELNLLEIMSYGEDRYRLYDNVDVASTAVEGSIPLPGADMRGFAPSFSTLSLTELMRGGTGFMQVELTGMLKGKQVATQSRLVLATDLGMVSKVLPDGSRQVYVCSLSGGQPLPDIDVRILGANGQSVAGGRTDAGGHVHLPAVRGLTREKAPVALVALRRAARADGAARGAQATEAVQDLAWMALDDSARRVDYSRFPTQGQTSSPDNINAYVFGQRGIYRPGETLRFGVVIRRGDWKPLPPDMPLTATLTDPAGRVALRHNFTVAQGLAELDWTSPETAPTGRYRLDVTTPASTDIVGTGAVRVSEFQPDTLSMRAEVVRPAAGKGQKPQSAPVGWVLTSGAQAPAVLDVHLRNFYGLPAEGRKIRAELSVTPATLTFPGYEDFIFPDVMPLPRADAEATATRLPEVLTTAEGTALVPLPLAAYQNRTLFCRVLVEGFEADGGRAVTVEKTFLASPLPVMLGYRLSGAASTTDYVPQGTRGGLEFVALGPDLRPVDGAGLGALRLSVAERRYVTVLSTDAQGKYVYEESPVDKEVLGSSAALDANGRHTWAMPTDRPGDFLLTVRDGAGKVMARIPYTVAGNDDLTPALRAKTQELPSTQLRLRLDKTDYAPGDTVNIFLAAPYEGAGLITLERDRVARHVWFRAPAGHSVHTLTIPEDFEGRGYINVTLGRAVSSPEIFMQPHSYAVAPLTVNAAGRDMGLNISAPAEVLPGSEITARVTARHAGKALVFAVDEGVLQLTRFATPAPLRYLLLDRALEVHTDQFFDLLMPVHAQMGKRLAAFGGDMHLGGGRFHNPFKRRSEPPLAWWSGLVDVGPQGTEVRIPVPVYTNSQVRLMAVGVSSDTVGAAEAGTVSRAPLVITPQLPLMSAPGDVFEGGIGLHNTTANPVSVALRAEAVALNMEKGLPEKVDVPAGREVFVPLRMAAGAMPGEASLTVTARATGEDGKAGHEARRTATLSLRPPVLPRQQQQTGLAAAPPTASPLKDGKIPAQSLDRTLYPYMADATASVSAAPLPPLRVLLRALAAYPYTCVEQSVSRAFPLVLLQRRAGLDAALTPPVINGKPRAETHARMQEQAMTAIRAAFRPGMGVASWPDAQNADSLLTAYAGDYLLSMREAGLALPGDIATSYFHTVQGEVDSTPQTLSAARAKAYGLWVLTRHGIVTAQWLNGLREHLNERWPGWEKDVTASLMAGSYAIMNMHGPAQELLNPWDGGQLLESGDAWPLTPLGAHALHVAVLARHFPRSLTSHAGALATRLVEGVNASRGSTLEAALGARALLELAAPLLEKDGAKNSLAGVALQCTAWQPGFEPAAPAASPAHDQPLLSLSAPGCTQFSLSTPVKASLYWEVSSDGYDRTPPAAAAVSGMEVTRTITLADGTPLPLREGQAIVPQGAVLRVELTARALGNATANGQLLPMVLADLLPGGFEMVLSHSADAVPASQDPQAYIRLDRREDRVLAYVSAGSAPVTFVYHWRAVNRGRYVLPAAYGEGLYDRNYNSHTAAGMISVQ